MNFINSIKFKASLLLLVFSLNSFRSLACALHADSLLYSVINVFDNHKEKENAVYELCNDDDDDCQCPEKKSAEKGCCDEKVVAFDHLDKVLSHSISGTLPVPDFELPKTFLLNCIINSVTLSTVITGNLRSLHLPPEDIRVSIQSFQI